MKNWIAIELYKAENGIDEELHTFQTWKELGYIVKKGEKSRDKIAIWKHTTKKNKDTGEDEENGFFIKTAAFFRASQVEKMEAVRA